MDDRAIVAAMVRRDPAGLDGAYRRYADPLYAYSRALLRDPDAAADVVHDTFLLASGRIGQLREADRLRPWLYAIARHECHRVLRGRARDQVFAEPPELAADLPEPGTALVAAQIRDLVDSAAVALAPTDREVIALALRHELSAAEVASVLGVSSKHAHALLSRARTQLGRAMGALLLARDGAAHCDGLRELLVGWDGRLTPLLRKRIARHVDGCTQCGERVRVLLNPEALLPAYVPLPFAAVAETLRHRPRRPQPKHRRQGTAAAVAAAVLLLLLIIVYAFRPQATQPLDAAPTAEPPAGTTAQPPPPTAQVEGGASPGLKAPTGTPTREEPQPEPATTTTTRPPVPVPFTVDIQQWRVFCQGSTYTLTVSALASGATLDSAVVRWKPTTTGGLSTPTYRDMVLNGQKAGVAVTGLRQATLEWWVRAKAVDGRWAETPHITATRPC